MSRPRCTDEDYIDFLIASPKVVSATEAARVQPDRPDAPAHDSFTRLLSRLEPEPDALWRETRPLVRLGGGVLVIDDTVLDKPYARKMDLVANHWSGKHHRIVRGIDLVTLLWTDGDRLYPTDYRIYHKPTDGLTKNDHFKGMLAAAKARGFAPECVLFDGWYASLENLKLVRSFGWHWLTRLKCNRKVNLGRGPVGLGEADIAGSGTPVHLTGYGMVKVFRIVATDGTTEHWATSDLSMGEMDRRSLAERSWGIEEYHRGLKRHAGVEGCQARRAVAQANHLGCAIRAFVRLEWHRFSTGVSWFEAKAGIIRDAVRRYLAEPTYRLPEPSTA